jgi:iron complex outermembrane recepter protein
MKNILGIILLTINAGICFAQSQGKSIKVTVVTESQQPLAGATVQLLKMDSAIVKVQVCDKLGMAEFYNLSENNYLVQVSHTGFTPIVLDIKNLQQKEGFSHVVTLLSIAAVQNEVTVTAKKPFVQFAPDKTVINVDAGITNAGTSI